MAIEALIIPTLILVAGAVDDLRSRKVHNTLVLILLAVATANQLYFHGPYGLTLGLLGAATALILSLPLVLGKVLGAGDMKLLVAFGVATSWTPVAITLIASLFWGGALGVARAFAGGQGLQVLKNAAGLLVNKSLPPEQITKIPYTVALLLGWMSFITIETYGGRL